MNSFLFSRITDKIQSYFIPPGLNLVERTRTKVLVVSLLIIFIISLINSPLSLMVKSSFPYHYLILGSCALLILLKVTKSTVLVGNLSVCLVFVTIASTAFQSGGIYSHDLAGLSTVVICSIVLLPLYYTYLYGFAVIAFIYYMFYISGDPEQLEVFHQQRLQYDRIYYLILAGLITTLPIILLSVLVNLNNKLINNLQSVNSKLDNANNELDKERHNLVNAKAELQKSNLKLERYAHTASHDLQQPIRTIISFTQLLSKKLERLGIEDSKIDDYISLIVSGTKRMDSQVQDLLSFSKVSNKEESHIYDMNEIVEDVRTDLSDMITKNEVEIEVNNLPSVNVIKSNLGQVFQNLISNAIKYKKSGTKAIVKISSFEKDDNWVICVRDNGIGIASRDINKIFKLYTQSSKENDGLGIGLATCQQIIESYGGQIWVESELEKGSHFYFTLPKITTPVKEVLST